MQLAAAAAAAVILVLRMVRVVPRDRVVQETLTLQDRVVERAVIVAVCLVWEVVLHMAEEAHILHRHHHVQVEEPRQEAHLAAAVPVACVLVVEAVEVDIHKNS